MLEDKERLPQRLSANIGLIIPLTISVGEVVNYFLFKCVYGYFSSPASPVVPQNDRIIHNQPIILSPLQIFRSFNLADDFLSYFLFVSLVIIIFTVVLNLALAAILRENINRNLACGRIHWRNLDDGSKIWSLDHISVYCLTFPLMYILATLVLVALAFYWRTNEIHIY